MGAHSVSLWKTEYAINQHDQRGLSRVVVIADMRY